jgi:hypothetical protein
MLTPPSAEGGVYDISGYNAWCYHQLGCGDGIGAGEDSGAYRASRTKLAISKIAPSTMQSVISITTKRRDRNS